MIRPHQFVWIGGLGFLLGIAIGMQLSLPVASILIASGLAVFVLLLRPLPTIQVMAVFMIALLLGWWRCQTVIAQKPLVSDLNGHLADIQGQVVGDPAVSGNQQRIHLLVETIDEQPRRVTVLLTAWHLPEFQYADRLAGRIKFALPQDSDEFRYSNYLAKDGIYLIASQAGNLTRTLSVRWTVLGQLYRIKHQVDQAIHRFLPEPHGGLLSGLLLGIKTNLSDTFRTALKNSGTSHIVALSGFNLTIIIAFLLFILRSLPRRLVWLIAGIAILGFVVMTGAASSVVRAAIMGWLLLLAGFWGRRRSATNAIILALVTMVLINPLILSYDVGFQLSVAATVGLLYGAPLFYWRWRYFPKVLSEALAATAGATIFTLPLIALYFGGISWVTLFANLLVVPLVPYVMLIGCTGVALFLLWPALQWLNLLVWPLSALLFSIVNWFGNLPIAFVPLPPLPAVVPVLYYLILISIIYYASTRRASLSSLV